MYQNICLFQNHFVYLHKIYNMGNKPSTYQEDVFEFIQYGYGNAVISAVAGSGKSSTLIMSLDKIKPEKKVLFLAFNNSIVNELKQKISRENTDIKTLHSLGFSILRYNYKDLDLQVDEFKYDKKLIEILSEKESELFDDKKYLKNILQLCSLGRFFMANNSQKLLAVANKYNIIPIDDELQIAKELISWSKESIQETKTIDYTDMVYLPSVLPVRTFKYDFIFVDEAQDLSITQLNLFMKCFKQGGRFIAVLDEKQAIYGFAGSDSESYHKLIKTSNTTLLPLSICYRCPKKVIRLAREIVPEIQWKEDAIEGEIKYKATIEELADGDMVICRNTSPLIKLYATLITNGIKAYIKGTDVGLNLIDILESTYSEKLTDVFNELNLKLANFILNNSRIENTTEEQIKDSQEYNDLSDKIDCLKILSIDIPTKKELIEKIKAIFSDENKSGICLSTIHKAKGLEADNVYILDKQLMPSKCAKQEWELQQEENLRYVAYTRPRKILGFIENS